MKEERQKAKVSYLPIHPSNHRLIYPPLMHKTCLVATPLLSRSSWFDLALQYDDKHTQVADREFALYRGGLSLKEINDRPEQTALEVMIYL